MATSESKQGSNNQNDAGRLELLSHTAVLSSKMDSKPKATSISAPASVPTTEGTQKQLKLHPSKSNKKIPPPEGTKHSTRVTPAEGPTSSSSPPAAAPSGSNSNKTTGKLPLIRSTSSHSTDQASGLERKQISFEEEYVMENTTMGTPNKPPNMSFASAWSSPPYNNTYHHHQQQQDVHHQAPPPAMTSLPCSRRGHHHPLPAAPYGYHPLGPPPPHQQQQGPPTHHRTHSYPTSFGPPNAGTGHVPFVRTSASAHSVPVATTTPFSSPANQMHPVRTRRVTVLAEQQPPALSDPYHHAAAPTAPSTTTGGTYMGTYVLVRTPTKTQPVQVLSPTTLLVERPGNKDADQKKKDQLSQENAQLRQQVQARDATIARLEERLAGLEAQVADLRQSPPPGTAGGHKISQIPIEDMLRIMREYGSEVSHVSFPKRKANIQKASVVRQFRRWNPHFFEHFCYSQDQNQWIPKLGKEGELKRRAQRRVQAAMNSSKKQKGKAIPSICKSSSSFDSA